ncbi:ABC transporter substrate-binding protein [Roseovarius indicus]|uniref:4,5-dihydroxyphthalate decarboxylase n=2 Tax=Roseovarius indicus TaxID=540747 RepID=A0A5P3A6X5_9RHOB|nr:ABC transporter substrate-binding protein [Roseovarius indicus]QEW25117.1 4,5-dihydroxyphthalate decarboxylase [Roseovarius indicus]SFE17001.1 4,5-dihydroxyphthalate decarboxylase [Roseovarius indicus]
MPDLTLSIAMGDYDRTRPIHDGRVKIDGVSPVTQLLSPEEMFFRAFRHQAFDISELSFSSYCVKVAQGDAPYIAVPVFLSRAFRHSSIYIRTDKGIEKPQDLKGKRIGIAEWQLTANVWARGILEGYGVHQSEIEWVRGGMHAPGRPEKIKVNVPDDVTITAAPEDKTLDGMLRAGEIDGYIGPRALNCFDEGHPQVGRLFADGITAASEHFERTGIFPIMHVLGIRRHLADTHPWLPGALLKAFTESKRMAETALADTSATKVTMPFVEDTLSAARRLIGPQIWTYGVPGNEKVLEAFVDIHHRQGLSPRRLSVEELFHPATFEAYSL